MRLKNRVQARTCLTEVGRFLPFPCWNENFQNATRGALTSEEFEELECVSFTLTLRESVLMGSVWSVPVPSYQLRFRLKRLPIQVDSKHQSGWRPTRIYLKCKGKSFLICITKINTKPSDMQICFSLSSTGDALISKASGFQLFQSADEMTGLYQVEFRSSSAHTKCSSTVNLSFPTIQSRLKNAGEAKAEGNRFTDSAIEKREKHGSPSSISLLMAVRFNAAMAGAYASTATPRLLVVQHFSREGQPTLWQRQPFMTEAGTPHENEWGHTECSLVMEHHGNTVGMITFRLKITSENKLRIKLYSDQAMKQTIMLACWHVMAPPKCAPTSTTVIGCPRCSRTRSLKTRSWGNLRRWRQILPPSWSSTCNSCTLEALSHAG